MTFEEYLKVKKIDPKKMVEKDNDLYENFKNIFEQVSPQSFTQQKLFLINYLRRQYYYEEESKKE